MEKRISATRVVREFSEVLNTIKFKGAHYVIERGGKPVATMKPVEEKSDFKTLGELKVMLEKLPRLDDERDGFLKDLADIRRNQPPVAAEDLWE